MAGSPCQSSWIESFHSFFLVSSKVNVYSLEFRPREKEKGAKVRIRVRVTVWVLREEEEEKEDDDDDKDEGRGGGGGESAYIQCDEKWIRQD